MKDDDDTEYTLYIIGETKHAWIVLDGEPEDKHTAKAILPKSQCTEVKQDRVKHTITLAIPQWLAEKEGLA